MYIESMLMRGDDLYEYKYRHKVENPFTSTTSKNQSSSNQNGEGHDSQGNNDQHSQPVFNYLHIFLEQQSMAYAKKCTHFPFILTWIIVKKIQ